MEPNTPIAGPKPHEYATLFPPLDRERLEDLAANIKQHGLHESIIMLDGKILDGRNRHAACVIAGVQPRYEDFTGTDPLAFVLSKNLHRRHLTDSQRGMIAAELATMKNGGNNKSTSSIDEVPAVSRDDAARALSVSTATVDRAKKVKKRGTRALAAAVKDGRVSLSAAEVIVNLAEDEQDDLVAAGAEAVKEKAVEIRKDPNARRMEPASSIINPGRPVSKTALVFAKQAIDRMRPTDTDMPEVMAEIIEYCHGKISHHKKGTVGSLAELAAAYIAGIDAGTVEGRGALTWVLKLCEDKLAEPDGRQQGASAKKQKGRASQHSPSTNRPSVSPGAPDK